MTRQTRAGTLTAVAAPPLRAGALVAAALMLSVALGGCAGPADEPAPTSTPVSSPSPEPSAEADPLSTVAEIVARVDAVELRSPDGTVVAELAYTDAAASAVATLTEVLGAAPSDSTYDGTSHGPGGVNHEWPGVTITEPLYESPMFDGVETGNLVWPNFYVILNAPDSGGITLTSPHGNVPGDAWAAISTSSDVTVNPSGCSGPYEDRVDVPFGSDAVPVGVVLRLVDDGSAVRDVVAPFSLHLEGCA